MGIDAGQFEARALRQNYPRRLAVAVDQFLNAAAFGPLGDTISSRMWRWAHDEVPRPTPVKRGVGRAMDAWLNWLQPLHGLKAQAGDLARSEAEETRTRKVLEHDGAEDIR